MTTRLPSLCRSLPTALAALITGCSLLSIKSPEKPLSPRDLNARILTHAFAARFELAVEQRADVIAATSGEAPVRLNALRWKIAASGAGERAASQVVPILSLLDLWALSEQMQAYLDAGAGRALFGAEQPGAVSTGAELAREAREMARNLLTAQEFEADRRFVADYVAEHPLVDLDFARASVADSWARGRDSREALVASLGTVPEAMADAVEVLRMYGESAPSQALWRAQLAVQQSGVSGQDVQRAFERLDARFARVSAMADSTPGLVDGVVRDAGRRFDAAWLEFMSTVRAERTALSSTLDAERQAATADLDRERAAVDADAARLAGQVIEQAGRQARMLLRDALLLAAALAVVVLGLPFAAGYALGRGRRT